MPPLCTSPHAADCATPPPPPRAMGFSAAGATQVRIPARITATGATQMPIPDASTTQQWPSV
jgi:hypothetical protein